AVGRFDSPIATWLIHLPSGLVATAEYRIIGDSAIGEVTFDSGGVIGPPFPLWGVRADSAVLLGGVEPRRPEIGGPGCIGEARRPSSSYRALDVAVDCAEEWLRES